MWLRLHPPFTGKPIKCGSIWTEIELPDALEVDEFIQVLATQVPSLTPYLRSTSDETFYHMLLIRKGYVLKPKDMIQPDDRVDVHMPLTGG